MVICHLPIGKLWVFSHCELWFTFPREYSKALTKPTSIHSMRKWSIPFDGISVMDHDMCLIWDGIRVAPKIPSIGLKRYYFSPFLPHFILSNIMDSLLIPNFSSDIWYRVYLCKRNSLPTRIWTFVFQIRVVFGTALEEKVQQWTSRTIPKGVQNIWCCKGTTETWEMAKLGTPGTKKGTVISKGL